MDEADQPRRDLPPHHGYLLNVLGMTVPVLAFFGLFFPPLLLVAFPLALGVWLQAWRDLAIIRAGRMDPRGRREPLKDFAAAVFSLLLSIIGLAFWAIVGFCLLRDAYQD